MIADATLATPTVTTTTTSTTTSAAASVAATASAIMLDSSEQLLLNAACQRFSSADLRKLHAQTRSTEFVFVSASFYLALPKDRSVTYTLCRCCCRGRGSGRAFRRGRCLGLKFTAQFRSLTCPELVTVAGIRLQLA